MAKFNLTAQLVLRPPTNTRQVIAQIKQQLAGIDIPVKVSVSQNQLNQLKAAAKNVATINKATKDVNDTLDDFGKKSALAFKRFLAFTLATSGFVKFVGSIKAGIGDAIDFERQIVKVSQVSGTSVKSLSSLSDEVTRLSVNLGASSSRLIESARILSQAGLTANQTRDALEALAKTELAPTFDDIINTTEGSIAIMQQFGIQAKDLEKSLGAVNAVAGKFAVESDDLIAAVRRTGGAFAAAGGDLNELIALFTSVRQTTRESAETIATGFRTIFTRIQRLRTQRFLENLGIELRDAEGQFKGPIEAIRELSFALKEIRSTDPRFAQIVEELGGFRQVSKVIPLIQQFEVAERALAVAQQGQTSLTEDAIKAQQALGVQIQIVKEEFAALLRTIVDSSSFKSMVNIALNLAKALIKVTDALTPLLPLLSGFLAIKVGQAIPSFAKGLNLKGFFGFASGGLVPGSGNRDTVPAALTPGEFVIRKSAVNKIGVGALQNLNAQKFQSGGLVDDNKVGAAILDRSGKGKENDSSVTFALSDFKGPDRELINKSSFDKKLFRGKTFSIIRGFLSDATFKIFDKTIDESLIGGIQSAASKITSSLGLPDVPPISGPNAVNFARSLNDAERGNMFENILIAIRRQGLFGEDFDNKKPFDFENGLPALTKDDFTKLANIRFVDAKASRGAASDANLAGKIKNQILDEARLAISTLVTKPTNKVLISDALKATKGATFTPEELGGKLSDLKDDPTIKENFEVIRAGGKTSFRRLNRGGQVDSVPALLTPGEFVVTKDAARKVGYGTLNRINKFNKGGVVGFQSGGRVNTGGADALSRIGGIGFLLSTLSTFTTGLIGAESKLTKLIDTFTKLSFTIITVTSILQTNLGQKILQLSNQLQGGLLRGAGGFASPFSNLSKDEFKRIRREEFKRLQATTVGTSLTRGNVRIATLFAKEQEKVFNRRAAISRGLAGAGLVGGVLGGIVGGQIQSAGLEGVRAGRGGEGLARLGGAISGAGTGAAIGAVFGPLGVIVGGVIGGFNGLITASKQVAEELRKLEIGRIFDRLSGVLESVASGRGSARALAGSVREEVGAARALLFTTTGANLEDLTGNIKSSLVNIDIFLNEVAKGSESLDEFNAVVGQDVIRTFAQFSNIPIEEVIKRFGSQIDAQNRHAEALRQATVVQDEYNQQIQQILQITTAINEASLSIKEFNNSIDTLTGFVTGLGASQFQDLSDIIGNASGFSDRNRFVSLIQRDIVGVFGDVSDGILQSSIEIFDALDSIPKTLGAARGVSGLEENIIDFILQDFQNANIQNIIRNQLNKIIGSEGKPENLIEQLREDFAGVVQTVGDGFKPFLDSLADFSNRLASETQKFAEILAKRTELESKIVNELFKVIDVREERERQISELTRRQLDPNVIRNIDASRQRTTLGVASQDLFNNPQAIALNITRIQESILKNEQRLNRAEVNERAAILDTIERQKTELNDLNKTLELLSDATSRAAGELLEFSQVQIGRDFLRNIAEKFTFAEQPSELRDLELSLRALAKAERTRDISSIPRELRGDVLSLLQDLGEGRVGFLGGASGTEVLQDLISNRLLQVFGPAGLTEKEADELAQKSLTDKQQELIDSINAAFTRAELSGQSIVDNTTSVIKQLTDGIDASWKNFITELRAVFTRQELSRVQQENLAQKQELERLQDIFEARSNITSSFGLTDEGSIKALLNAFPDIRRRENARQQLGIPSRLGSVNRLPITDFTQGLTRASGGTTSEVLLSAVNIDAFVANISEAVKSATGDAKVAARFEQELSKSLFGAGDVEINQLDDIVGTVFERIGNEFESSARRTIFETRGIAEAFDTSKFTPDNLKLLEDSLKLEGIRTSNIELESQFLKLGKATSLLETEVSELAQALFDITQDANIEFSVGDFLLGDFDKFKQRVENSFDSFGFNSGGRISGFGNKDTVPAMLTPGEFVLRKDAVNKIGIDNLEEMNRSGVLPEFNRGGRLSRADRREFIRARREEIRMARREAFFNRFPARRRAFERRQARIQARREAKFRKDAAERFRTGNFDFKNSSLKFFDFKTFNSGGKVDSVPAMLTPGEFVVNKGATEAIGENTLNRINRKFAKGGQVKKFQDGGIVGGGSSQNINLEGLSQFDTAIKNFAVISDNLSKALNNFPREISLTGNHTVEVIINGAQVMTEIIPEVKKMVEGQTKVAINNMLKSKFPDVGTML